MALPQPQAPLKSLADVIKTMSDSTSASAKTLSSLRTTTETMNTGVHDQIALFYDPAVAMTYDMEHNRINLVNTGRTGVKIASVKVNGEMANIGGIKLVSAGTTMYIEVVKYYKDISAALPKGSGHSFPVEIGLENELGKHFTLSGALYFVWDNEKVVVHGQTISLWPGL